MRRIAAVTAVLSILATASLAQTPPGPAPGPAQGPGQGLAPGCALTGSADVRVEGRAMLRLSDVAGCPGLRYEIIPGLHINGEPAVKLLPNQDGTGGGGAASVRADGKPVARQGDAQ